MGNLLTIKIDTDLELRQLEVADAAKLFELVDRNRSRLREWLPWVDGTKTVEDSLKFIQESLERFEAGGNFGLGIRVKGELAGVIGIHDLSKLNHTVDIGYWLSKDYQGQGIMTAAVTALVKYLFSELKVHRIVIKAATQNSKSQAIPQRLGFKEEGIEREAGFLYDHYVDLQVFSLLDTECNK